MSSEPQKPIVTRMAPSPTGRFHVGGIRTAFYNYALARKYGGIFLLRIEDTDHERSAKEFEDEIFEAFAWVGMDYDQMMRQSERLPLHQESLRQLIDSGKAYEAEESKDGTGEKVIRLKNPNTIISFDDQILGTVSVDTTDLGDFVIARNIESPLYHFAVVVDDYDMGVTNVIRAQEHVANTPRQILIQEALGYPRPTYAHVPFILGADGKKKLSKRDGDVAILDYRSKGYLPDAMLNFLCFIGWNPGGEQEIFSKDELVQLFDIEKVQKSPGNFNLEKLNWINREHIKRLSLEQITEAMAPYLQGLEGFTHDRFKSIVPILVERIHVWSDLNQMIADGEVQYFFTMPSYDPKGLVWKNSNKEHANTHLKHVYELLQVYTGPFEPDDLKQALWSYAEEVGKGDVLWPLRYALSGKEKSPDPFVLLAVCGKDESLSRIANAVMLLEK